MAKKTSIFIDSCAWNILHRHNIDLAQELPSDEFDVLMTKEVGSFETPCIPESKRPLKDYIQEQIEKRNITTDSFFGFADCNKPPEHQYRVGGFGEGRFVTLEEDELIKRFTIAEGKEKKSGLYKNEADASLAVRACAGSIVLTAENKDKRGPLRDAAKLGGRVVDMADFDLSSLTLREFISSST